MGLNFQIRIPQRIDAHWSYSGFHAFRDRLDAGIESGYEYAALAPLMTHSDCDGTLSAKQCERVAPALREIVSRWPEEDFDRVQAELLADAMDEVAEAGGGADLLFT